jgi:hypothetical protein
MTKKNIDEINAKGLIDLALIFARNNGNEFFKTDLLKQTTYTHKDIETLTNNYVLNNLISLEDK